MDEVTPHHPLRPSPKPIDPHTVAVVATMVVFVAFLVAGLTVQPLNLAFGIWFSEIFVFLGLGWYALRATLRNPVRYAGLSFPGYAPVLFGFLLGVANFFAIVAPIQYISLSLLPESWRKIYDVADIFRGQAPVELAVIIAGVCVAAPLCEEFFFRGLFLKGLNASGGAPLRAIIVSSIVFSAFHLDPVGFLARVELGVLFGWLFLRTGSLWPGMLAHSANNLISTVLFFIAEHLGSPQEAPTTREELLSILMYVGLGSIAFWGLMAATRRYPGLLGGPPPGEAPEGPVHLEPPTKLLRLAAPWMLAAALSLGAYVVLDARGIQVSQIDQYYPLPPIPEDAPDALHAERESLYELRIRARKGEIPLGEYAQERARQSKQKRKAH